jgi:hypothetical protein
MSTQPNRALKVVGRRAATGHSRTSPNNARRDAAYRRLTATIFALDVASLARQLRSQRVSEQNTESRAA